MVAPGSVLDVDVQDPSGSPLQIGQVIAGKYRIDRQIGRGGMGVVLAATHLQLETLVAIKVMRRDLLEDDRALSRLLVEARSAAKIRSEHVARVLDVGTLESGSPFIVMEYLEGEDLADLLDRQGALEVEQAVTFMLQACEALAEVHMAEMVHRDLKPGNLFIARAPDGSATVKIVDFGISKQIGGTARERAATTSPQVLGSPFYMAPEQMRAEAVDERSDIWALGAILFEMLTGRPPFVADTLPEVYAAVLHSSPPAIDQLRPGVPPGLDDIVQRCLDKDPAQRFCDVADLAEALAPFGGSVSVSSVDRITRILTNPEPFRARPSMPPHDGHGTARGGTPVDQLMLPASGIVPSPAPAVDGGMGTWAESSSRSALAARASLTPGGFGPLTTTGADELSPPRRRWPARLLLAAGAIAVVGAIGLLRSEPEPVGRPLEGSASRSAAVNGRVPGPAEESKAPSLERAEPDTSNPVIQIERRALKTERARRNDDSGSKRRPSVSVDGFRAAVGTKKKASGRRVELRSDAELAATASAAKASLPAVAPRAAAPSGEAAPSGDREPAEDPWNPDSFGDRR